jgi:DNA-binding GntR family transcriptional regulator
MNFEPVMTLTEQIATHLSGEIISGRLKPMTRIQELKVAGELGVSRGSVREALLILESRHLIEIIPRRGAVVSAMESNEIANFCELYTELQRLSFSKLAAINDPDLSELELACEEMAVGVNSDEIATVLRARQHFLLASLPLLDNFYLGSVLKGLVDAGLRLAHLVTLAPNYDARDTLRYHQALLEAISDQQVERVQELVQAYHRREKKLALGCADNGADTEPMTLNKNLNKRRQDPVR